MDKKEFSHASYAHCESGVVSGLLCHEGINISEPMAFGIGAGLFFGHMPFLKVGGSPGTTYRIWPGAIFKRVTERLGIQVRRERFSDPAKAMQALDAALQAGKPVGMSGSVFYLPYLPEALRFHFNAHNFIATGIQDEQYVISDPILDGLALIGAEDLIKSRFAKGYPEPKGLMYYITGTPRTMDMEKAIRQGIQQMCRYMLWVPFPWFGNRAIFLMAREIKSYPIKLPPRKALLYLGNIVRMQEEIGTGGGGFRYLYAAFLQEAGQLLHRDDLLEASAELTAIGDHWRNFAFESARVMKERREDHLSFAALSELLIGCGNEEKVFFNKLRKLMS